MQKLEIQAQLVPWDGQEEADLLQTPGRTLQSRTGCYGQGIIPFVGIPGGKGMGRAQLWEEGRAPLCDPWVHPSFAPKQFFSLRSMGVAVSGPQGTG